MCGICGQFNFTNSFETNLQDIKKMTDTIAHRGPDDEGFYVSGQIGLGFRRLSIIDLAGGRQPMSDNEQMIWVVFNGEIYNFKELRKELESFGHVFRTNSDTEVIVYGYKQWGKKVLDHLNGMFGLAIWDENKKQLLLARDRLGIKFVYYKLEENRITFGSEIRPILSLQEKKTDFDHEAIYLFLRYRFTPSPHTIIKGIRKLAPGTLLTVTSDGKVNYERWWNYKPTSPNLSISPQQAEEQLAELYKKAVKRQLVSDVPLGLLLSGGVDSALLLSLMNSNNGPWNTFTVGYGKGFKDDEIDDAEKTANIFNSKHSTVQINRTDFESTLSKVIHVLEEPIAPSSMVPMYYVCQLARTNVKTALVGQGPDELLGGYPRHLGVQYGKYWRALPHWLRQQSKPILNSLPRFDTVKRGVYSLDIEDRMERYKNVFAIMSKERMEKLFKDTSISDSSSEKMHESWGEFEDLFSDTDELGGFNFIEARSTLPDELLLYADKISMAHGLELRVPFLDHEIVEFVETLPASLKVRYGGGKWLHKQVAKRLLPTEIIHRKKRGFAVNVVDEWFRESLTGKVEDTLLDENSHIYDILHYDSIENLINTHQAGKQDNHKMLFSLIALEEILRSYN